MLCPGQKEIRTFQFAALKTGVKTARRRICDRLWRIQKHVIEKEKRKQGNIISKTARLDEKPIELLMQWQRPHFGFCCASARWRHRNFSPQTEPIVPTEIIQWTQVGRCRWWRVGVFNAKIIHSAIPRAQSLQRELGQWPRSNEHILYKVHIRV